MQKMLMPQVPLAALIGARPAAVIGSVRAEGAAGNVESLLREVRSELTRISDDVRKTAENAFSEAKRTGALSEETKQTADKLLTAQSALESSVGKLEKKLEDLDSRNLEIEQRMNSGRRGNGPAVQTLGAAVAAHEAAVAFAKAGAKGTVSFEVMNAITSGSASAGSLIASQRESEIVGLPRRQFFVRDLLSRSTTTSNLVQYPKQLTRTLNAGVVAETTLKPESDLTYGSAEAPVRTIAHWIPVSRQAMDDAPQLQGEIDNELIYGLDLAEEAELLSGDGTGQHLSGLLTNATEYSGTYEPADATAIDRLRFALLEASLAMFSADGIVLHEVDWAKIETTKDASGWYILANPTGVIGPVLWGKRVVPTPAFGIGEFLVGAFKAAATIYDRMGTEILMSTEDRDNFVKNMITVRAEKRLALAVKRPGALIHGELEWE